MAQEKKYILLENDTIKVKGHTLHRIQAVRDFGDVKSGDLGGYIEGVHNLSHVGTCWVSDNAKVYGCARVYDDAQVGGNARIYDDAKIYGNAQVWGDAQVYGNADVFHGAQVYDKARVYGYTEVCGWFQVCGSSKVHDKILGNGGAEWDWE